jgi:hypothetical protein
MTSRRLQLRALSGWATAAMLSIAAFAVAYLLDTLSPVIDAWAARQPAGGPATQVARVSAAVDALVVPVSLGLVAVSFVGWLEQARVNAKALTGTRSQPLDVERIASASAGPEPASRTRMLVRVWLGATLTTLGALAAGLYAFRDSADEAAGLHDHIVTGRPVDGALAAGLFARQIAVRFPSALLLVVAAVLALFVVHRITSAQYAQAERFRKARSVQPKTQDRIVADLTVDDTVVGGTIGA